MILSTKLTRRSHHEIEVRGVCIWRRLAAILFGHLGVDYGINYSANHCIDDGSVFSGGCNVDSFGLQLLTLLVLGILFLQMVKLGVVMLTGLGSLSILFIVGA